MNSLSSDDAALASEYPRDKVIFPPHSLHNNVSLLSWNSIIQYQSFPIIRTIVCYITFKILILSKINKFIIIITLSTVDYINIYGENSFPPKFQKWK